MQEVLTADEKQQNEQACCRLCLRHNRGMPQACSWHFWAPFPPNQLKRDCSTHLLHGGVSAVPRAVQEVVTAEVDQRAEQVHCVLCLGHNKGMEEAATSLAVRRPSLSYSSRASPFRSAADWRGKAHLCSAARIAA